MDLFEKIFQKIVQSEVYKKQKSKPGQLFLRDIEKLLVVFAHAINTEKIHLQLVASRDFVGLYGMQLFLPEKIDFFENREGNKKLYQNLILQILAGRYLKIQSEGEKESLNKDRWKFLEYIHQTNSYLDGLFPEYRIFQMELVQKLETLIKLRSNLQKLHFEFWKSRFISRTTPEQDYYTVIETIRNQSPIDWILNLTVPCRERKKTIQEHLFFSFELKSKESKNNIKTELVKNYSEPAQYIDLEKEKQNPVMHSFEKLETADLYEGGRRVDSGDDQLEDHSRALDELNLSKITRGGRAAQSAFYSETFRDDQNKYIKLNEERQDNYFFYPEWNVKKSVYMKDHCRLVENPLDRSLSKNTFKEDILSQNQFQIRLWQNRIQSLLSEPLWVKRLSDGEEIDIDQVIHDLGALYSQNEIKAHWYMNRKKMFNDIEVMVLFDQSHSSDSWVCNRRVLDITLESLGTMGLLFDSIIETVTVAGVWSSSRFNCSFQIYKSPDEPWSYFYSRASKIQAQGYTRLGPAIRHATYRLKKSVHRNKLMLLITDAKPTDVDGYEGVVGVSDVAQACREAGQQGILHYVLVLDQKQKQHFSKMFSHFTLLYDPKKVSEELFNILHRLIRGSFSS